MDVYDNEWQLSNYLQQDLPTHNKPNAFNCRGFAGYSFHPSFLPAIYSRAATFFCS